jgi:Response regulator of the LytR/AlgR family
MKINCVIIDDEKFAIDSLVNYCNQIELIHVVKTFTDPYKALHYLESNTPDLVFLDIQMPEISGIQIANDLKDRILFVFTTAYTQFAINGFNLNAVDYLLKPISFERFTEAVEKVKAKYSAPSLTTLLNPEYSHITVKVEYTNVVIESAAILYIEAMDNYCRIYTCRKIITTLMSLKRIVELLPVAEFIRIHKSFVISRSKIERFTKEYVVIAGKILPVGRVYSKNLMPNTGDIIIHPPIHVS